jgi:hypothetical protein
MNDFKIRQYYPVSRDITAADESSCLWSVQLAEIRVGDSQVELPSGGAAFVLDTGSSRFKGDPTIVDHIVNLITDNGTRPQAVKDPADLDSFPDFTIVLVDQDGSRSEYTLSVREYFYDDIRTAMGARRVRLTELMGEHPCCRKR